MFRNAIIALALITAPAAAQQSESVPAAAADQQAFANAVSEIPELGQVSLPGPGEGEHRTVYYWRPPNAPPGPLPVIYMGDGLTGLMVAASNLRPLVLSGQVRPFVVVAMDPHPGGRDRTLEYALPTRRNALFNAHLTWFTETVIPWAELRVGASTERAHRFVGGYSNSADFALTAVARRPDLFSGALAHSPVNVPRDPLDRGPTSIRWAISAGHTEYAGDVATLTAAIVRHIGNDRAIRRCLGMWSHDLPSWRAVSQGTVVWLLDLGDPAQFETPIEREHCRNNAAAEQQASR